MRDIKIEDITNKNIEEKVVLKREEVEKAIEKIIKHIDANLDYFKDKFPSPATKENKYDIIENIEWTDGFYTGMLWLAYEYTGDEKYRKQAERNVESFYNRIQKEIEVYHHDLGFLYTPSCVAAYKLTGNEIAKKAAIMGADKLIERYQAKSKFIQAWGSLESAEHHRFIIDCLLNLPLLYWASNETGDPIYRTIADNHFETSLKYVIRDDASAFHTYYMNPEDGSPLKGVTRQGYSDDSSWARGQAWGVYGLALNYMYKPQDVTVKFYEAMTNYFINRLPQDDVCYWDLIFTDGDGHVKDSSAAAIAVCGIIEMQRYLPETTEYKYVHLNAANRMLKSLIENYHNENYEAGQGVLKHGVYSWHSRKGFDECNIWGDYYYFEALMRYIRDYRPYW